MRKKVDCFGVHDPGPLYLRLSGTEEKTPLSLLPD